MKLVGLSEATFATVSAASAQTADTRGRRRRSPLAAVGGLMQSCKTLPVLGAILLCAGPVFGQPTTKAPQDTAVSDLVVLGPTKGPVWWQVSKGDSVVWIMGAPPARSQGRLAWDKTAYRRRLAKARVVIVPYGERVSFLEGEIWPALPADLANEVAAALIRLGDAPGKSERMDFADALRLRDLYIARNGLEASANVEIVDLAEAAGVPLVRVPITRYTWRAATIPPADAQIAACTRAMLEFVRTPPERFNRTNEYWAIGDLPKLLAINPKGVVDLCRRYSKDHRNETIAFQTFAVMEALRRPGNAVAVYPIDHIIAEDGILAKLSAKGFAVAGPREPVGH
jgi:hypothetical protein